MKIIVLLLLALALAACQVKPTPAPPPFVEVRIESHPAGWGYAHKTVTCAGVITGGHLSGGPDAPFVHQTQANVSAEDLATLARYVAAIPPQAAAQTPPPDQKTEGFTSVIVVKEGGGAVFHAKWGQPFSSTDVQAIWDLLAKYRVGAW